MHLRGSLVWQDLHAPAPRAPVHQFGSNSITSGSKRSQIRSAAAEPRYSSQDGPGLGAATTHAGPRGPWAHRKVSPSLGRPVALRLLQRTQQAPGSPNCRLRPGYAAVHGRSWWCNCSTPLVLVARSTPRRSRARPAMRHPDVAHQQDHDGSAAPALTITGLGPSATTTALRQYEHDCSSEGDHGQRS